MQDVLLHYLEVNFADIADQLAQARAGAQPGEADRAAAADRLRGLLRSLRQNGGATATGHGSIGTMLPAWRTVDDMVAFTRVEIEPAERAVLDHFFTLFGRSMDRTTAQAIGEVPTDPVAAGAAEAEAAPIPAGEGAQPVPARLVGQQVPGWLHTVLLAAAQQALDLLQVDASQVFTTGEDRRFYLRAGVPTESLALPEAGAAFAGGLLARALDHTEVLAVEDLATESLTPQEVTWVDAGYHGFAAIALAPPLDRPIGILALFRRTPWRLDRKDARRLEDLAAEAIAALRPHSLAVKVEEVAVLQERIKIAREIHDGLASDLAAVVALFKYYEQRRERDPVDAAALLPQLRAMTEEVLAGARNVLHSLRPKTIRSHGLLASVLKLVDQFGRMNLVEANTEIRGEENWMTPEQKDGIFQILRESLSNVRKHAQARTVWVRLDLSSMPWTLSVRDDGRGFEPDRTSNPAESGSYGLVGMRERAELLDASLEVSSRPGEGTTVTLIGPMDSAP
ncbi:MAG TPA: GAF domain-containing sensor histidine kinase [Candidatus Limnocylindrales bacterium]|nr:GAF domain-containing sensor histidine kinase [Candidatus Limnocylindrales bacterium]